MSYTYRVYRPQDDLVAVRQAMRALPRRTGVFGVAEGVQEGMLRHGSALFRQLRWIVVSDGTKPVAVLPLELHNEGLGRLFARCYRSPSRFELCYGDMQAAEEIDPIEFRRCLQCADETGQRAPDILRLRDLQLGSASLKLIGHAANSVQLVRRPGTSLLYAGTDADQWLAGLSKNLRGQIRQAGKRLGALGQVEIRECFQSTEVDAGFDRFVELERLGYKGTLNALAVEPADREILRTALVHQAAIGGALVMELWINERLAASQFGLLLGSRLFLIKVAYNEEFLAASPGTFLIAELMKRLSDRSPGTVVDCCVRQPWHDRWHPNIEDRCVVTLPNPSTVRGRLLDGGRAFRKSLDARRGVSP